MGKNLSGKELPKGIRQRKDGRYEGRFTYQGESYTLYNRNLRELVSEMQDKRYEVTHGIYAKKSKITVDSWFNIWLDDYKRQNVKFGTYKVYRAVYDDYIRSNLGRKKLQDIRGEHIQRLFNEMARKYSRSTINLAKVVLNSMFEQACKNGIVMKNPVKNAIMPRKKKCREIRVLTVEEQKLFLQYAQGSIYFPLYVVALGTGMRNGELRALQWKDVDFAAKIIRVQGTLKYVGKDGTTKYRIDSPKTQASRREIPMLDEVYRTLECHKKEQMKRKMLLGELWEPQEGFDSLVFTGATGRCIAESALCQDMKKIEAKIREAGYDFANISPHALRHTFATRGMEKGIPPKVMQELLGHTSITMTLDIYSHVLPNTKAQEIKKLTNMF